MRLSSKVGRRRFLKYVGAGLVTATAAGAGYYLYTTSQRGLIPSQTEKGQTAPTPSVLKPPVVSEIQVKPRYINPTPADTVEFSYGSFDTGNNPLWTTWLIDWKTVSHERKYSTKLSEGDHSIVLKVSDGRSEATKYASVMVDPDQIYPTKPLQLKYKGVDYCVGTPMAPEWGGYPSPNRDQIDEEQENIHNDLGCNAIIIMAGADSEDDLIECARMASQKGFFDRVYVQPRYWQYSMDETVERLARFAPRVRALREASEAIHFMVGHEFSLETSGMIPGDTWSDRVEYTVKHPDWGDRVWATFPRMFKDIIAVCKENYGYKISYAAIPWAEIEALSLNHIRCLVLNG